MASSFDYPQAQEIKRIFAVRGIQYLFIGKSGAILLGFPDTTQDADLFVKKDPVNCAALVHGLKDLGFSLDAQLEEDLFRGKDFVQIRTGPFDLDVVFAPDGIETFDEAARRAVVVEGFPVCHLDDIIRSKEKADRVKDREALPRLKAFREWWISRQK